MPISHVSLPVSSLPTATAFYVAVLKPLNYDVFMKLDATVGFAPKYGGPDFWIHRCPEEKGQKEVQKTHVAFVGKTRAQVRKFYETALKVGAKDNGKPGERDYTKGYYAAYVLDPDGNNIECLYYQPLWLSAIQWAPMVLGAAAIGGLSWFVGAKGLTV